VDGCERDILNSDAAGRLLAPVTVKSSYLRGIRLERQHNSVLEAPKFPKSRSA
jgi:hypothetical protein